MGGIEEGRQDRGIGKTSRESVSLERPRQVALLRHEPRLEHGVGHSRVTLARRVDVVVAGERIRPQGSKRGQHVEHPDPRTPAEGLDLVLHVLAGCALGHDLARVGEEHGREVDTVLPYHVAELGRACR